MPILSIINDVLAIGSDSYSTRILRYKVEGGDLVLYNSLAQLARRPVAGITNAAGQPFTDQSIIEYLDGIVNQEETGLSSADRAAIVSDVLAQTPTGTQRVAGTPSPVLEGDIWTDTSQSPSRLMTLKGGVAVELDTKGDLVIQDLSGNIITTD